MNFVSKISSEINDQDISNLAYISPGGLGYIHYNANTISETLNCQSRPQWIWMIWGKSIMAIPQPNTTTSWPSWVILHHTLRCLWIRNIFSKFKIALFCFLRNEHFVISNIPQFWKSNDRVYGKWKYQVFKSLYNKKVIRKGNISNDMKFHRINPLRSDPVYIRDPSVIIALPADVLAPTVLGHQQA